LTSFHEISENLSSEKSHSSENKNTKIVRKLTKQFEKTKKRPIQRMSTNFEMSNCLHENKLRIKVNSKDSDSKLTTFKAGKIDPSLSESNLDTIGKLGISVADTEMLVSGITSITKKRKYDHFVLNKFSSSKKSVDFEMVGRSPSEFSMLC